MNKLKALEDRLSQVENKLNEIEAKINNLILKIGQLADRFKPASTGGSNIDSGEFERLKHELEKLKRELEELRNAHGQTILKVNDNKEKINLILARLDDITKGYKNGDEKLQKEIDDLKKKLSHINSQIDI